MTHYATLGVTEEAGLDEIKKAYRKLASANHPDKGGDTAKFQAIQAAYDVIGNEQSRAQYDASRRGTPGGVKFTFNGVEMDGMPPGMDAIFQQFGFGQFQQPRRNKDLRIEIPVTLASLLDDQKKTISVQTTNGHRETVEVTIPRGAVSGTVIKYPNLGDNFFNTLPRGDLFVHVAVIPQTDFSLENLDIRTTASINCLDAMSGTDIIVSGVDGQKFKITVPAGIQPGSTLRIKEQGIWQLHGSHRGNLLVKILITVPQNLTSTQLELIAQIKQSL